MNKYPSTQVPKYLMAFFLGLWVFGSLGPSLSAAPQGIFDGRLDSPMNGNGKTITNLATIRATNFINAATGLALSGMGVTGAGGITATTNAGVVTLSLYTAPAIATFVNNRNNVEIGSSVTSTLLDWTLSGGAITSQSVNQGIGSLAIGLRTYTHTSTYTTDRTYTLTVSDGTTSPTANTTITFLSKAYWGVSALTTLSDAQIIALSSEFATARQRTKTLTASNQYIYFAYPAAFGLVTRFVVGGFHDTAWTLEGGAAQNFVNAALGEVSYYVYRSNDTALGADIEIEIE